MAEQTPRIPKPFSSNDVPWITWSEVPLVRPRYRHLTRAAAGDRYRVGLAIEELDPGTRSAPAHYHAAEEEHVYVLSGHLTARLGPHRIAMTAGDYVCFPAGQEAGHCLINEGTEICRYVIIGENRPQDVVFYPDSDKVLIRALGQRAVFEMTDRRGYWHGEPTGLPAGTPPPPAAVPPARPATEPKRPIAARDVAWEPMSHGRRFGGQAKHLTYAAVGPDYRVGVLIEAPAPGRQLAPLHYHMGEEEQALILEGRVTLRLGDARYDLVPGDYAYFPAGLEVGHAFLNGGDGPCSYLMVGERNPADVCVYPESDKMAVSALGKVFDRSATRGYWDGEDAG